MKLHLTPVEVQNILKNHLRAEYGVIVKDDIEVDIGDGILPLDLVIKGISLELESK